MKKLDKTYHFITPFFHSEATLCAKTLVMYKHEKGFRAFTTNEKASGVRANKTTQSKHVIGWCHVI